MGFKITLTAILSPGQRICSDMSFLIKAPYFAWYKVLHFSTSSFRRNYSLLGNSSPNLYMEIFTLSSASKPSTECLVKCLFSKSRKLFHLSKQNSLTLASLERKFVAVLDHRSANYNNRNLLHYFPNFQKQVRFLSLLVISNRYVSQIFYGMLCYKGSEVRISVVVFCVCLWWVMEHRMMEWWTWSLICVYTSLFSEELTRLWNLCPDNMEACKSENR